MIKLTSTLAFVLSFAAGGALSEDASRSASSPGAATSCCTYNGRCALEDASSVGDLCYCPSSQGPFTGEACK